MYYQGQLLEVAIKEDTITLTNTGDKAVTVTVKGKEITLQGKERIEG